MAMKTPGVYIVEKNAFPNSVVEVATAVPAFIGYTEKASNSGTPLKGKPWRIASMAEYQRYFGGAPKPVFTIKRVAAPAAVVVAVPPPLGSPPPPPTPAPPAPPTLDELKQKVGESEPGQQLATLTATLAAAKAAADAAPSDESLKTSFSEAQAKVDSATKAVAESPQGVALSKATRAAEVAAGSTALKTALATASVPAVPALPDMGHARVQWVDFKLGETKTYLLHRAAGKDGGRFLMHQAMRHFFQNGGGPCYIVSVGSYDDDISAGGEEKGGLIGGVVPLLKEQEPTMVLTPDAVLLPKAECVDVQTAVLKHCGLDMRSRVAILDVWGGDQDRQYPMGSCIDTFRGDIGINFLDFAAAYYPWLHTSLVQSGDVSYSAISNLADLKAMLLDELDLAAPPAGDLKAKERKDALDDLAKTADDWKKQLTKTINDNSKMTPDQQAAALKRLDDKELADADSKPYRDQLHKMLMTISSLYPKVMEEIRLQMNLMPPSAAMAGLYTMVDNTRGVWKAPANISVAGVIKPAVEISHADQEDLNVTTQGKSINAIRSFIGEGALVWGARTLDGNSLDWRYISVRRTMIMLEESCRLAAKAMVFEPNVANTWVTIKSMISNFLVGIWKRGGLAGAVPDDAFSVHVGLGETMTPEDILEGILRVTVLVAISRPAEFIEITFQQQMQKS